MARIQNVSGRDRIVPSLNGRLVASGQVIEVPDDLEKSYTDQTAIWKKAKAATKGSED